MRTLNTTAMGPATLTSILLASQHQLGSNVVVVTDGEANTGLGSFGWGYGGNQGCAFYEKLGRLAANAGVTVNLLAVVGANCNIGALS